MEQKKSGQCKMDVSEPVQVKKKMTIPQLKKIARDSGLSGYSHMNKAALLTLLCSSLNQEKDLGAWHGYGYEDMDKKNLAGSCKRFKNPLLLENDKGRS